MTIRRVTMLLRLIRSRRSLRPSRSVAGWMIGLGVLFVAIVAFFLFRKKDRKQATVSAPLNKSEKQSPAAAQHVSASQAKPDLKENRPPITVGNAGVIPLKSDFKENRPPMPTPTPSVIPVPNISDPSRINRKPPNRGFSVFLDNTVYLFG